MFYSVFGQEPLNIEQKITSEQSSVDNLFKKNKFTVVLYSPGFVVAKHLERAGIKKISPFTGVKAGFYYNFSEIISIGFFASFSNSKVLYVNNAEIREKSLNFYPSFKVNLGKNQMFVPFIEASYICSIGNYYNDLDEEFHTKNYVAHVITGAIGVDIYASRWFKKTKYKNNFGITLYWSRPLLYFDNAINVPTFQGEASFAIFYRF